MGEEMKLVKKDELVKLNLACGQDKKEGFTGVDISEKATPDVVLDILKFPWPWKSHSVDEIHCSHFIEHIPMETVRHNGRDKDLLFAFFDECWRVLKPDGRMMIWCPCARSNRAFQDPTHRRFIVAETFLYLAKEWRDINKLDHYAVDCNYGCNVVPIVPSEMTLLHAEAQTRRFNHEWNTVQDWQAELICKK